MQNKQQGSLPDKLQSAEYSLLRMPTFSPFTARAHSTSYPDLSWPNFVTHSPSVTLRDRGKQNYKKAIGMITWDQTQFERFSYILSNGYSWNFRVSPCPPECNFLSETKIEPDLRLSVWRMKIQEKSMAKASYWKNPGLNERHKGHVSTSSRALQWQSLSTHIHKHTHAY